MSDYGMNIALADEVSDLAGKNMRLEAENEQLKKDVEHWKRARESALAAGDILRAENERLKWMFNSLSEELQEYLFDEWHIFCNAALEPPPRDAK